MNGKFQTYKGYPLVRSGKQIYYGFMSDPYVILIQILGTKKVNGEDMTTRVKIVQMDTVETDPRKAFVKNHTFDCGLYEALDIADIWLKKALGMG